MSRAGAATRRRSPEPYIRWLMAIAPAAALAAVSYGLLVLVGYGFGWERLWRPIAGGPAMHPYTAISIIFVALAAWLARPTRPSNASALLAVLGGSIAVIRLSTIAAGTGDVFQSWSPFGATLSAAASSGFPISMGLRASIMIVLLALALVLARLRYALASQLLAVAATYPPVFSLVVYIYGEDNLAGVLSPATLICGLLCAIAVLGRTACRFPLRSLLAQGSAGRVFRYQLVVLLCICIGLGLIATQTGFDQDVKSMAVEISILVIAIVLVLLNAAHRSEEAQLLRQEGETEKPPLLVDLEAAIDKGQLALAWQPQVNLADGRMIGAEVLARWTHPARGPIPPAEFIALAEASGLINPLGAFVLEAACMEAARWRDGPLAEATIAVNVSPLQLRQAGFYEMVMGIVANSGLAPTRLLLELTETAMVQSVSSLAILARLREAGIRIAIDDFGTGYSSLSYLLGIPCDYLKIDQSFIRALATEPKARAITRAIVAVGRSLDLGVVAEGIETAEQASFLESVSCDKGQGYFYGHPMTADELKAFAEHHRTNPRMPGPKAGSAYAEPRSPA